MTELTRTIVQNEWLVIKPDKRVRQAESSAEVDAHTASINQFLAAVGVEPLYRADEIQSHPENKQFVISSPLITIAIQVLNEHGMRVTRHCKRVFKRMLENLEHHEVRNAVRMGNKVIITFPADLGPPDHGEKPQELTMTMLMENPVESTQPLILIGRGNEFDELEENAPKFQPIRFSAEQFQSINQNLDRFAHEFGKLGTDNQVTPAEWVRLPESMIGEQSNVAEISYFHEAGKYLIVMEIVMTDGTKQVRLINNSQKVESKIIEGDNYCIVIDVLGVPHFVVVDRTRVNGEHKDFIGQKIAFPRGFAVIKEKQFKLGVGTRQTGIDNLADYQVNDEEQLVQDPTMQDVRAPFNVIKVPPNVRFDLQAKQDAEPLAPVEQLVPTLLSISDAIDAIADGTLFNDAHTIAMAGIYLFRSGIIELTNSLADGSPISDLCVAMQIEPDYRTGGERLTLFRDQFDDDVALGGPISPDTGVTRIWHNIGLMDRETAKDRLKNTKKAWKKVKLVDLVNQIRTNSSDTDIVTIAAITKLLLQNGLCTIHREKLSTDTSQ